MSRTVMATSENIIPVESRVVLGPTCATALFRGAPINKAPRKVAPQGAVHLRNSADVMAILSSVRDGSSRAARHQDPSCDLVVADGHVAIHTIEIDDERRPRPGEVVLL